MVDQRRIRIAWCLDSFKIGGTELNAVRTAEALDPDRFELSVFHLSDEGPLRERYERLGVPMNLLPIHSLYSLQTLRIGYQFAAMLRKWQADIVHSHCIYTNIFAAPWARIGSRGAVIASRRWGGTVFGSALSRVNSYGYKFCHRALANSESVAKLLRDIDRVPDRKIVTIPNFLEDRAFNSPEDRAIELQRQEWGIAAGGLVIGMVARLAQVKNHLSLLRAFAALSGPAYLVLVGDGAEREKLESTAVELGVDDRVVFTGQIISDENIHAYFDVSVLSSFSEGFPNSLIEAMAAARPVVATRVGGVVDAVEDDVTGILVEPDDSQKLAGALQQMLDSAALRARCGEAGRRTALRLYRMESVVGELQEMYQSLTLNTERTSR